MGSAKKSITNAKAGFQKSRKRSKLKLMWSFVGNKQNQRWLWRAIDHETGEVLAYVIGLLCAQELSVPCEKPFAFQNVKESMISFLAYSSISMNLASSYDVNIFWT